MLFMAIAAIMAVISVSMASCADPEEGETWSEWEFRNFLIGFAGTWSIQMMKDANGNWITWEHLNDFYFSVKFKKDHSFESEKFSYREDGYYDESTREAYDASNKTYYTISKSKIIECTVDGQPYFRFTLSKKPDSTMEGTLFFYRENKSYYVILYR